VEPARLMPPQEETAKRFAQVRKLFVAYVTHWKTTLLTVVLLSYCWRERFWRDPVTRLTCPLLLFLLCLPILDDYGFSFFKLFRKYKDSRRP
jgi:hypothetical protein